MAIGRRCSIGCESWPDEGIYAKCPRCGETTTRYSGLEPLSHAEAKEIRLAEQAKDAIDPRVARFEAFYATRCRELGIPIDGPLPSEYEDSLPEARSLVG